MPSTFHQRKCIIFVIFVRLSLLHIPHILFVYSVGLLERRKRSVLTRVNGEVILRLRTQGHYERNYKILHIWIELHKNQRRNDRHQHIVRYISPAICLIFEKRFFANSSKSEHLLCSLAWYSDRTPFILLYDCQKIEGYR